MAKARARRILVDSNEKCEKLKNEILDGGDFTALARSHSTCPSGREGGNQGEFGPGQMVQECDDVVFCAGLNAVHGPLKTHFGYQLLAITQGTD